MAKNSTAKKSDTKGKRSSKKEGLPPNHKWVYLYPLEPTSIDPKRIDAAIDAVIARRKNK